MPLRFVLLLAIFFYPPIKGLTQKAAYNPDKLFSEDSLKADLLFLKQKLETIHPALYRYTPQTSFTKAFDSLINAIQHPMKEQEFLGMITTLNAKIRDGHTMILPSDKASSYNNIDGKFLPFSIMLVDDTLVIAENCSGNGRIGQFEQVLSINSVPASVILKQLKVRQIRDGNNETYPQWILSHYFSAYYSFCFGQPDSFYLELKNSRGLQHKENAQAQTRKTIQQFRQIKYGNSSTNGKDIELEIKETGEKRYALLTVKTFDADRLTSVYKKPFQQTIDSLFRLIKQKNVNYLVLDLRDNQGGDFEPGRHLLSCLLLKPFQYLYNSDEAKLLQPAVNRFGGHLYVLINGGSFSNTAIVSAALEKEQRAVFIGEETGGNKYVISGEAEEEVLPHTGIRCYISTTSFMINKAPNNGHGVFPVYPAPLTFEDLKSQKDTAKELVLKLIGVIP